MKKIVPILFTALAVTIITVLVGSDETTAPTGVTPLVSENSNPVATTPVDEFESFDKDLLSLDSPDSLWVIVNKRRGVPTDFVPENLTVPNVPLRLGSGEQQMQLNGKATEAVESLFAAARQLDLQLQFGSGYRSASLQSQFYNSYTAASGREEADRFSARPGHSEHQTGLGLDFTRIDGECHLQECFSTTAEGIWLADNAHTYGFLLRYPSGMESVTGYIYEPWHYRYVGIELAEEFHNSEFSTLEQFFGLEPAPEYL